MDGGSGLKPRAERRLFRNDRNVMGLGTTETSSGSQRIFVAQHEYRIPILRSNTGAGVATLKGHTNRVWCLAGGRSGGNGVSARVVSGSGDQTLRVWDVDTRTCVATLKGHINGVKSLAVMGGCGIGAGALVVSGSWVKPCKKT